MGAVVNEARSRLGFYLFIVVFVVGTATYEYFDEKGDKAAIQDQVLTNCREIEEIKEGGRMAAWRDFNNLNTNLRLLGLEKTHEIVRAAKYSRDRRLEQYARQPCPRP